MGMFALNSITIRELYYRYREYENEVKNLIFLIKIGCRGNNYELYKLILELAKLGLYNIDFIATSYNDYNTYNLEIEGFNFVLFLEAFNYINKDFIVEQLIVKDMMLPYPIRKDVYK